MNNEAVNGPPKEMFGAKKQSKRRRHGRNEKGELDAEFMSDDEF